MAVNSNDDARFKVVEYSPEKAEMIGYSNYSYWKSVFHNFLKKKSAVALLIVFVALVVFSFVALVIGNTIIVILSQIVQRVLSFQTQSSGLVLIT